MEKTKSLIIALFVALGLGSVGYIGTLNDDECINAEVQIELGKYHWCGTEKESVKVKDALKNNLNKFTADSLEEYIGWINKDVKLRGEIKADISQQIGNPNLNPLHLYYYRNDVNFRSDVKNVLRNEYRNKVNENGKLHDFEGDKRMLVYGALSVEVGLQNYKPKGKLTDKKLFEDLILNQ